MLAERAALSPLQFLRSNQISQEVAALTEDIEELHFRKEQLLASVPDGDIKSVAHPVKERYAWVNYAKVHVFSTDGLPLAPFVLDN